MFFFFSLSILLYKRGEGKKEREGESIYEIKNNMYIQMRGTEIARALYFIVLMLSHSFFLSPLSYNLF